ncbi:S-layer homology domain-containing protein [Paenibacillus sp. P25]|nr:S-layer homology domain-containing protein [Paenibacillus sp. P25]
MSPYSSKMKAAALVSPLAGALYGSPAAYAADASSPATAAMKTDMQLAYDKGAVEGYPNDTDLHGSRPVTRAELVTMLNRAAKLARSRQ